jgi:hypothetical protein
MGLWNTHAERTGVALAGGAVLLVGGSVAASSLLAHYPGRRSGTRQRDSC